MKFYIFFSILGLLLSGNTLADFGLISDTNGSVAHCAIEEMNGSVTQQYYDTQEYIKDPRGIQLMTESAPLVVPSNKNGVVGGSGFITL